MTGQGCEEVNGKLKVRSEKMEAVKLGVTWQWLPVEQE